MVETNSSARAVGMCVVNTDGTLVISPVSGAFSADTNGAGFGRRPFFILYNKFIVYEKGFVCKRSLCFCLLRP